MCVCVWVSARDKECVSGSCSPARTAVLMSCRSPHVHRGATGFQKSPGHHKQGPHEVRIGVLSAELVVAHRMIGS